MHAGITPSKQTHPRDQATPQTRQPPAQCMLGDTVNKWVVCILLECNLATARKRSLGQGNIFAPVCHSVHRGVPGPRGLLRGGCLLLGEVGLLRGGVPGGDHCCGRYASYWNAFLFHFSFCLFHDIFAKSCTFRNLQDKTTKKTYIILIFSILTSPAPWKSIFCLESFLPVTRTDANRPAKVTEAVPSNQ